MNKEVIPFPENYSFNMGLYFSRGWELFKKGAGSFIGFTILYLVILVVLSFIPMVNIVSGLVQYLLIAGVYIFSRNLLNNKDEFSQFFLGFNYFLPILFFFLVISFFILPLTYLLINHVLPPGLMDEYISGELRPAEFLEEIRLAVEANSTYVTLMVILITIIAAYLYVSYSFTLALIADSKLQFWDAMEASRKIIGQKFFHFLGMYILLGILMIAVSVITCGLGIMVALPFSLCVIFSAYDEIIYPPKQDAGYTLDGTINIA